MITLHCADCLKILRALPDNSVDSLVTDPPAGISFMGKNWDHDKGGRCGWIAWMQEIMADALRVLKPGAHGLVWALPRTSHWTATALENAGFEIRDIVNHIFGTGFPKSLNIGKAIDNHAGIGRTNKWISENCRPNSDRGNGLTHRTYGRVWPVTSPATPEAKQWDGWGTALKPAHEHWILVRKPLGEKTVAANVLRHGTGGINVDGCRIEAIGGLTKGGDAVGNSALPMNAAKGIEEKRQRSEEHSLGRFPANLILSEEAAADLGEPAKFFYVTKASKSDKGAENTHPTVKNTKLMEYLITLVTPPGGIVLDPFMGSGSTGVAAKRLGFDFLGIEQSQDYFHIAEQRLVS